MEEKKLPLPRWALIAIGAAAAVVIVVVIACVLGGGKNPTPSSSPAGNAGSGPVSSPEQGDTEANVSEQLANDRKLDELAQLYEQNPDLWGWLRIEGTQLDEPIMYTPENEQKYIYMDFDGNHEAAGELFIDKDCSVDPMSDNLIIYGHNMRNGSMFKTVMHYEDKSFWEEHPIIEMYTLSEKKEFEVVAAFYDKVYYKTDTCFKFYQFVDAADEAEFNEAYQYYKTHSEYDTGVTAEYGDQLITLVTCSYHEEDGRFVVIGREIKD